MQLVGQRPRLALVVQGVERPAEAREASEILRIEVAVDLELLEGPAGPVAPEIGVGQARPQARLGGRLGQVVLEVGLALPQLVLVEQEPALRGDQAVGIRKRSLLRQDRLVPAQGPLLLFDDGLETIEGPRGFGPLPRIRVDVVEPHRGCELVRLGLEDLPVEDFRLLRSTKIEARVGHGLVDPPGHGLAGLPVEVELPQGVVHPVLLAEGDDVVAAGTEIAGVLFEDRLDLGDCLVGESPAELRHRPIELEGPELSLPTQTASLCDREGLEARAVLLQQGHLDGIERLRRDLPRLLRLEPRRIGACAVAHPHLRVDGALEGLFVFRIVGQAEPVQLEGLRVLPDLVVGPGHVAGKVADLAEVLLAGGIELNGLLVRPRPDQAQGIVGLEVPVVGQGLQGPLQQGERLVVAAVPDPLQGFPVILPRLDCGVRRGG